MRNALAIARKELSIYFTTPWAYVFLLLMVALTGFFFVRLIGVFQEVQVQAQLYGWNALGPGAAVFRNLTDGVVVNLWASLSVIVVFFSPILTMRIFAEEKRQKSFELLMTLPVRPWEIVAGKFLGAVGVMWAALAITLAFPLTLAAFGYGQSGSALEWNTVLLGFAGILLWGATTMAIGMFISSLTESQMLAGLISVVLILVWYLLDGFAAGTEEPLRSVVAHLAFQNQLKDLLRGVLSIKPLVFFASVNLFALMLTHRTVEAQRWA